MSNGRVAAITGAGSGVEAATARSLAATGANVVLGARRYERLRGVLEATEQRGGGAFAMRCNFTTRSASRSPGASRIGALRGIWRPRRQCGVMPVSFVRNLGVEEWERMVDVKTKGVLYGTASVLPSMPAREADTS